MFGRKVQTTVSMLSMHSCYTLSHALCVMKHAIFCILQVSSQRKGAGHGGMAGRSQPNANDNFVEQLLRSGPDVSGYDQTEAEAEEVDYGETDEETRDVEGSRQMERGRGTRRWAASVLSGGSSLSVPACSSAAASEVFTDSVS